VGRVGFYRDRPHRLLSDLPEMDKAQMLAAFAELNRAGIAADTVRATLAAGEERVLGLIVGQSTGTTGNRGLYVISDVERFTWLGTILAKTLPDIWRERARIGLIMPSYGALYASAPESGRVALKFFDLRLGVEAWRPALVRYAPDTLIAPPKVLRLVAETTALRPKRVFSGGEVLDPVDRAVIEGGFGVGVRDIYMATEGLLGVACPHGTLHLAEDVVAFEWRDVPGSPHLATPLITDFTRRTQIMARYRMNDLILRADQPCPCGSPLQAVRAVIGRADDMLLLTRADGSVVPLSPDVVRNAIVDASPLITDFRLVQTGPEALVLHLDPALPGAVAAAAQGAVGAACARAGAGVTVTLQLGLEVPFDHKLRRVRRAFAPSQGQGQDPLRRG
jgi:putative adenylate-forming enzyme